MKNKKLNKIKGATMTEYALVVGLIAGGSIIALTTVGSGLSGFFSSMSTTLTNVAGNL